MYTTLIYFTRLLNTYGQGWCRHTHHAVLRVHTGALALSAQIEVFARSTLVAKPNDCFVTTVAAYSEMRQSGSIFKRI